MRRIPQMGGGGGTTSRKLRTPQMCAQMRTKSHGPKIFPPKPPPKNPGWGVAVNCSSPQISINHTPEKKSMSNYLSGNICKLLDNSQVKFINLNLRRIYHVSFILSCIF